MQLDQRRYSMRVCLKDIIGTDEEKVFMQYLEDSRTNFNVPVLLKFWYNDGTISDKKLDNFVRNYKHILAYYGTKIYSVESLKNGVGDDAWFNVTNETGWKDKKRTFRFTYVFDNLKSPIWGCVNSFVELVNFHTKEKPEKKPFKRRKFDESSSRRKS
jgi:hypothetical protein|tara:strand:+ start:108 stop:581 length:474 start_codon:yes stop_codon:yes gene_type:complete